MTNSTTYHIPVLLNECLDALNIKSDGIYVDATFGGGGHSREIFKRLGSEGILVAFDQDPDAIANTWKAPNFHFIAANFAYIPNHLKLMGIEQVDGILADLGVSSHQFDETTRGFSIRGDAPLDMRMNSQNELNASKVVNEYDEEELFRIFNTYGEVRNARKVAHKIMKARTEKRIRTTGQLLSVLQHCAPQKRENKYFAQVFQAIRIEVNDEMGALERFLESCPGMIRTGGRLVVMSYHSLEDRMVKNFMKKGNVTGEIQKDFYGNVIKDFTELVRHPIIASDEEIERNKRARSAKLRIAERNG